MRRSMTVAIAAGAVIGAAFAPAAAFASPDAASYHQAAERSTERRPGHDDDFHGHVRRAHDDRAGRRQPRFGWRRAPLSAHR